MLKNYLKVALRNIRKNPGYSFINIFGLVLGMGVSILILLYVQYELSYDTYHDTSDRIHLSFWAFVMAGGIALRVAWMTISYRFVEAALTISDISLRSE